MQTLDISWERADKRYVAIDVHPKADYDVVCHSLAELQSQGILEYETCEVRKPGSFDSLPSNDA